MASIKYNLYVSKKIYICNFLLLIIGAIIIILISAKVISVKGNSGFCPSAEFRKTQDFRQSPKHASRASPVSAFRRSLLYPVTIATSSRNDNGISRENFRSAVEMDVIPCAEQVGVKQTSATVMNSRRREAGDDNEDDEDERWKR